VTCTRGSFATVKRATSLADGKEWAVKIIDKTKLDADDEAALKVEVEILQTVRRAHAASPLLSLRRGVRCSVALPPTAHMPSLASAVRGSRRARVVQRAVCSCDVVATAVWLSPARRDRVPVCPGGLAPVLSSWFLWCCRCCIACCIVAPRVAVPAAAAAHTHTPRVCELTSVVVHPPLPRVQVDHPNIVRLHQIFDCPKVFYMVRCSRVACTVAPQLCILLFHASLRRTLL
jgi:hypothetical protein